LSFDDAYSCALSSGLVGFGDNSDTSPVRAEFLDDGRVCLRIGDCYASAEPGGNFTTKPRCDGWERFAPVDLDNFEIVDVPESPRFSARKRSFKIPKVIHQTFSSIEALSASLTVNIEEMRRINSDWEYRFWTDKDILDFIYDRYGYQILHSFLRINPRYGAARADLFRYLCVYSEGGVYLDIKSGCQKPLNDILHPTDQFLLSQWGNDPNASGLFGRHPELQHIPGGEYQQWHVISTPGHPFLEQVITDVLHNIETYHEALDGVGRMATLRATGPIAYTLAISKRLAGGDYRYFEAESAGLNYRRVGDISALYRRHYSDQTSPLIM
jgi:hypothetical protein